MVGSKVSTWTSSLIVHWLLDGQEMELMVSRIETGVGVPGEFGLNVTTPELRGETSRAAVLCVVDGHAMPSVG
jgi:hypothetical protein